MIRVNIEVLYVNEPLRFIAAMTYKHIFNMMWKRLVKLAACQLQRKSDQIRQKYKVNSI